MFKKQSAVRTKAKTKRRVIDPNKLMLLRQLLVGVALFSLCGVLVTGLWYGTRITSLTLATVTVEGGETIPHPLVKTAIATTLDGSYLGLIPRRFAWWYPEADMYANLSQVARIKDPVIERVSGTELHVSFDEYVPYALWCAERTSETCLFFDQSGYAFGMAPKLSGGALIRYRTLGKEPAVGSRIAEAAELESMASFIELVDAGVKFDIGQVETDTSGDVFYILAGGGEIKATLRDEASVVYENLRTILAAKEFSHIQPGNFQYIDLRFGNKVFVNEELIVPGTSTSTATTTTPTEGNVHPAATTTPHQ